MQELQDDDPMRIGPYRLAARLGAGGMGRVFLGRSPGGRLVAVKVIRDELAGDADFRARFRHEVAGARLVSGFFTAPVVDADLDGPVPWLVTGYVPGPSLAAAVTAHGPLPVASVLVLAAALAEGLGAIHAAGVVHRDMKPANVLLAADGPRIIDFGIARATESTALTRTGWAMGSPGFMSPEQATGGEIGPASDVFSLGAVLAFAATGSGPFGSGAADALLYRIVHEAPDLDGLPEAVRGAVGRCLAKDPRQRPTAGRLLDELGGADLTAEWLPAEVVREFAAVMPGQPALPGATALPGVSSPAGATARLHAGEPVIASALPDPLPDPARAQPPRDYDLRDDVPLRRPERAGSPPARLEHEALVKALTFSADSAWLATVAGKTVRLWDTALRETTLPHAHQVTGAEFSPDATRLATRTAGPAFGSRHQVALWDTATGTETARLPHRAQVIAAGFSPDGTRLATATVTDTAARLWDPLSGEEIARLGHGSRVSRLIFSPHGARIVLFGASGKDGSVWDTMTGREVGWIRHEHWIKAVAFSPDGTRLVSFSEEGATLLWDAVSGQERPWNTGTSEWDEATGRELKWTERMPRWNAAFSPDGTRLATAGADGTIRLWDPATGDELARMWHDSIWLLVYSPDGGWLATASAEGTIKLWDPAGGSERARIRHAGVIAMTALRLDGTRLVTVGGEDKMVRIWDPVSGQETSRMPRGKTRVFSPDGTVLATGGDRVTRLLDTATGRQLAAIEHNDLVRGRTFSPDGAQLAIRVGKAAYRWAM